MKRGIIRVSFSYSFSLMSKSRDVKKLLNWTGYELRMNDNANTLVLPRDKQEPPREIRSKGSFIYTLQESIPVHDKRELQGFDWPRLPEGNIDGIVLTETAAEFLDKNPDLVPHSWRINRPIVIYTPITKECMEDERCLMITGLTSYFLVSRE